MYPRGSLEKVARRRKGREKECPSDKEINVNASTGDLFECQKDYSPRIQAANFILNGISWAVLKTNKICKKTSCCSL